MFFLFSTIFTMVHHGLLIFGGNTDFFESKKKATTFWASRLTLFRAKEGIPLNFCLEDCLNVQHFLATLISKVQRSEVFKRSISKTTIQPQSFTCATPASSSAAHSLDPFQLPKLQLRCATPASSSAVHSLAPFQLPKLQLHVSSFELCGSHSCSFPASNHTTAQLQLRALRLTLLPLSSFQLQSFAAQLQLRARWLAKNRTRLRWPFLWIEVSCSWLGVPPLRSLLLPRAAWHKLGCCVGMPHIVRPHVLGKWNLDF